MTFVPGEAYVGLSGSPAHRRAKHGGDDRDGRTEDLRGAEDRARAVVATVADAEWPAAQGDAWMELARVLRAAGRPSEAEQASREALALYERKGDRPSVDAAMTFLDELGP